MRHIPNVFLFLRQAIRPNPTYKIMTQEIKHKKEEAAVLKSEYLFRRPWLTVRRETIELPNGHIVPEYYVLEYPDWVNTIAVTREGKYIFVRQYRHGLKQRLIELCSGVCDSSDATPLDTARRELLEETGYGGGTWRELMVISANPSTQNNMTHCFVATDVEIVSSPHLESSEDLSVVLLTEAEVREMLKRDEIKQALHAAPLWRYMAERE